MASLQVLVCLLGLVVLCHSACYFKELVIRDLNNPPKGCEDIDGKQHDFGTNWVQDCMDCSCTEDGLSCCSKIPNLNTVELPENCELLVDRSACSAKAVLKSDRTKECIPA